MTKPVAFCKEMVSTDGIKVGVMCGAFLDDEPWNVGVTAEEYHRQLAEAFKREDERQERENAIEKEKE